MTRAERDRLTSDLRMACMRISRRVRFESTAPVAPHQFSVLARLEEQPRTPKELAAIEKVSAPSMTRTVAGLVEGGLVARADDPADGRQVILSLTAEGRAHHPRHPPPPRPVVRGAAREAHRRRAGGAGAGHGPAGTGGRRVSPTFSSLEVRNYRLWASGALVSNIGTWMGRVGQDWLVLTVLTDGSATALGIVTGLQFLPFLLLAPWAGLIADRFRKRRILLAHPDACSRPRACCSASSPSPGRPSCGRSTRSRCSRAWSPPSTTRPGRPSSPRWCPTSSSPTPSR